MVNLSKDMNWPTVSSSIPHRMTFGPTDFRKLKKLERASFSETHSTLSICTKINEWMKYQSIFKWLKINNQDQKSLSLHLLYENSGSKEKCRCGLIPSNLGVINLSDNGRNTLSCWAFAIMTWTSCSCLDSPAILKRQITIWISNWSNLHLLVQ